jgi:hypothetical protein
MMRRQVVVAVVASLVLGVMSAVSLSAVVPALAAPVSQICGVIRVAAAGAGAGHPGR